MTVGQLLALLVDLPPAWDVRPNAVGNLRLSTSDGHYLGFIDVTHGRIEFDNRTDPDADRHD